MDQDIRCIVRAPDEGDTYVLLWIDKHDAAYQWARRRTCHVNRSSGALQVVDVEAAEMAVGDAIAATDSEALANQAPSSSRCHRLQSQAHPLRRQHKPRSGHSLPIAAPTS